jgi:hypothetical protein
MVRRRRRRRRRRIGPGCWCSAVVLHQGLHPSFVIVAAAAVTDDVENGRPNLFLKCSDYDAVEIEIALHAWRAIRKIDTILLPGLFKVPEI